MDLGFIVDIFASGGLAGIVGAVSGHLSRKQDNIRKYKDQAHELSMSKVSLLESKAERAHQLLVVDKELNIVETEGEIKIESKELEAFLESQKDNKQSGQPGIRWVRPIITGYLLLLATYISWKIFDITGGLEALDPDIQVDLLIQIVDSIFFLVTLAVGWFFGARGSSKK